VKILLFSQHQVRGSWT